MYFAKITLIQGKKKLSYYW